MLQPAVSHASFEIIHEVISKIPVGLHGENASKVFFVRRKITVTCRGTGVWQLILGADDDS